MTTFSFLTPALELEVQKYTTKSKNLSFYINHNYTFFKLQQKQTRKVKSETRTQWNTEKKLTNKSHD